jgi:hypothetical protein
MQILQHRQAHAFGSRELLEDYSEEPITRSVLVFEASTDRRRLCSNLVYGGQRTWRGEPVARTP